MDIELKRKAVDIINDNILTPVIYLIEDSYRYEFVCFCDTNITFEVVAEAEYALSNLLDKNAMVIDIREYCESDRMDIIKDGELIYTASPVFEKVFEMSMAEDFRRAAIEKSELLKRYDNSGTVYLQ